jgi:hypothetical protein
MHANDGKLVYKGATYEIAGADPAPLTFLEDASQQHSTNVATAQEAMRKRVLDTDLFRFKDAGMQPLQGDLILNTIVELLDAKDVEANRRIGALRSMDDPCVAIPPDDQPLRGVEARTHASLLSRILADGAAAPVSICYDKHPDYPDSMQQ